MTAVNEAPSGHRAATRCQMYGGFKKNTCKQTQTQTTSSLTLTTYTTQPHAAGSRDNEIPEPPHKSLYMLAITHNLY